MIAGTKTIDIYHITSVCVGKKVTGGLVSLEVKENIAVLLVSGRGLGGIDG
jgi:hypothetical protein